MGFTAAVASLGEFNDDEEALSTLIEVLHYPHLYRDAINSVLGTINRFPGGRPTIGLVSSLETPETGWPKPYLVIRKNQVVSLLQKNPFVFENNGRKLIYDLRGDLSQPEKDTIAGSIVKSLATTDEFCKRLYLVILIMEPGDDAKKRYVADCAQSLNPFLADGDLTVRGLTGEALDKICEEKAKGKARIYRLFLDATSTNQQSSRKAVEELIKEGKSAVQELEAIAARNDETQTYTDSLPYDVDDKTYWEWTGSHPHDISKTIKRTTSFEEVRELAREALKNLKH